MILNDEDDLWDSKSEIIPNPLNHKIISRAYTSSIISKEMTTMLATSELKIIQEWAQRYDIRSIYLFGSSLEESTEMNDIDLGIEGIPNECFFELIGKLDWALSKSIHVVNLDSNDLFAPIVRKYGRRIYE